jgi:hypothetical protein
LERHAGVGIEQPIAPAPTRGTKEVKHRAWLQSVDCRSENATTAHRNALPSLGPSWPSG